MVSQTVATVTSYPATHTKAPDTPAMILSARCTRNLLHHLATSLFSTSTLCMVFTTCRLGSGIHRPAFFIHLSVPEDRISGTFLISGGVSTLLHVLTAFGWSTQFSRSCRLVEDARLIEGVPPSYRTYDQPNP